MRFFEIELDEDQMRRFVQAVIDRYEASLHENGSYSQAVKSVQDSTLQSMENAADCEWQSQELLH